MELWYSIVGDYVLWGTSIFGLGEFRGIVSFIFNSNFKYLQQNLLLLTHFFSQYFED